MATTPSFVGSPRAVSGTLSAAEPDATITAGSNGSIVRRLWLVGVSDEASVMVALAVGGVPTVSIDITPASIADGDLQKWGDATDVLADGCIPGLSPDADRYFELGPEEEVILTGRKGDGTALESGETIHYRVTLLDY